MSVAAPFRDDGHRCNSCGAISYISGATANHCPHCGAPYDKKRNVRTEKIKEIRVRPNTGEHDIKFKVKKAIGFLQNKDTIRISILFRGREKAHIDEGQKVMQDIISQLQEYGKVINEPSQQSRQMVSTIAPKS